MAKKKNRGRTRGNHAGSVWTDPKTGYIYAVVSWTEIGPNGTPLRKRKTQRARNKTAAYELIPGLKSEVEKDREERASLNNQVPGTMPIKRQLKPDRITFGELAAYHKEDNLIPAVFNDQDVRICGLKTWQGERVKVDALVKYFGAGTRVTSLTRAQLQKYRVVRLLAPPVARYKEKGTDRWITTERLDADGKTQQRSAAGPHREFSTLRRMINFAFEEGWITVKPIRSWKGLINPGDEKSRTTIATPAAEAKLLEQCAPHLRPYLMTAFDHGCRSSELRGLLVGDVDFAANKFTVCSDKGKRRHRREIIMTPRVHAALLECCAGKTDAHHVFTHGKKHKPFKYAPRSSWRTAKRSAAAAGAVDLSGFRGHDMRHTMITRAVESGIALSEIGNYAGHRQPSTTYRYVNPDETSRQRIADVMANYGKPNVIPFKGKGRRKKSA